MKEERKLKIQFAKSGNGGRTTRMTIPISWIDKMGITKDNREVLVTFRDNEITIKNSTNK